MTAYYFEGNEQRLEDEFKACEIALSRELKSYSGDLLDYLRTEYDTPFSYFLDFTTCKEVSAAFDDGIPVRDYVDSVMLEQATNRRTFL